MKLSDYLAEIERHLHSTHSKVYAWFGEPAEVMNYRPESGGWTIREVLEHIALTSHFLLILIDKGADKAARNIHQLKLEEELEKFDFDLDKLAAIGEHQAFEWVRPEHMEPSGEKPLEVIKAELNDQQNRCLEHLQNLRNGEGVLYTTRMTVNELGRLNVYEYIYFLSLHAQRHLQQMQKAKDEFLSQTP